MLESQERPKYPIESLATVAGGVCIIAGPMFPPAYILGGVLIGGSIASVGLREIRARDANNEEAARIARDASARFFLRSLHSSGDRHHDEH